MSGPTREQAALAATVEVPVRATGAYLAVLREGTDGTALAAFCGDHRVAVAVLKAGGLPVTMRELWPGDPAMPPGARVAVTIEAVDAADVDGGGQLADVSEADLITDLVARLTQKLRDDGHLVLPLPKPGTRLAPAGAGHLDGRTGWLTLADRMIGHLQAAFGHQLAVAHRTGAEMGLADVERVIVIARPDADADGGADDAA